MDSKWLENPLLSSFSEQDLRQAMALGLYSGWQLSLDDAASMAGVGTLEFEVLLRKRCIPRHYIRTEIKPGKPISIPPKKTLCSTN